MLLSDPTCIFVLFRVVHGYKNVQSVNVFNGHKILMTFRIFRCFFYIIVKCLFFPVNLGVG